MILNSLFARQASQAEARGGWEVIVEAINAAKESATEINVTPETSLRLTAVFAAVGLLAETIGALPLILYERQGKSRRRATDHYLYPLLHNAPNPLMTAIDFRSVMQGYMALRGNAIAQIEYGEGGRVTELWPLRWENVHQIRVEKETGIIYYYYLNPDNAYQWLSSNIVWHLRGWGADGIVGYSPIELARRAVGLGLAAEEFGARFFGNDARPGIVLEHPGKLGPEAQKNLKESWDESHKGLSKSHRISILEEGMKLHEVGIPPEDAQFLETRKFQVTEIARLFRVPPHKIGDLERATFTNIEHQGIDFVTYSLQSWMTRWEQSIWQQLLLPYEQKNYYAEHLVDSLLRGDTISRYQAYGYAINAGWMLRSEPREKENLEPVDGLDKPLMPLNMAVVGEEGDQAADEPGSQDEPVRSESRDSEAVAEERARGSAATRRKLEKSYRRIYEEAARRIMSGERNDVKNKAREMLADGAPSDFEMWLDNFYRDDFPQRAIKPMRPIGRSYGEMVASSIETETGKTPDPERVQAFADSYTGGYGARHAGVSANRIRQAMTQARRDGTPMLEAVEDELDSWAETRAGQIASEESVRYGNAVAKVAYELIGVTTLRWMASGENCPFCNEMDGKIVGIKQNFLPAGGKVGQGDSPMTSTTDVGHPPLHEGCDCQIVAG